MKISFLLIWVVSALTVVALHQANTSWLLSLVGGALVAVGLLMVWFGVWLGRLMNKNDPNDDGHANVFGKLVRRRHQEP